MIKVVLPVYNQKEYLGLSINSVLDQSEENFILYVVDDGSTENIKKVVDSYREKTDKIKYLINKENLGIVKSLNRGFRELGGFEFITWTSADNISEKNWLKSLSEGLRKHPDASAAYSDYCQIDENGGFIQPMSKGKYIINGRINFGPSFMYRTEAVRRVGLFDEKLQMLEDRDYSIRMALDGPLVWVKQNLYKYRMHENSLTGKFIKKEVEAPLQKFEKKHKEAIRKPREAAVYVEPWWRRLV